MSMTDAMNRTNNEEEEAPAADLEVSTASSSSSSSESTFFSEERRRRRKRRRGNDKGRRRRRRSPSTSSDSSGNNTEPDSDERCVRGKKKAKQHADSHEGVEDKKLVPVMDEQDLKDAQDFKTAVQGPNDDSEDDKVGPMPLPQSNASETMTHTSYRRDDVEC